MGLDRIKNSDDRAAMELILSQQETGRPYLAPPGVPADRVQALQSAFDATMKDPDFIAAAHQANLWLEPMDAEAHAVFDPEGLCHAGRHREPRQIVAATGRDEMTMPAGSIA